MKKPKKNKDGTKAVALTKERFRDVLENNPSDKSLAPPSWVKPEGRDGYMKMIEAICTIKFNNITAFCRENGLARQTIYRWMGHQDTKDLVDAFIKTMAVADKPKVYEMVLSQVPHNAAYARLWMERYEDYQPAEPKSGNVIINFNFLDPKNPPTLPVNKAEDAEFEEN